MRVYFDSNLFVAFLLGQKYEAQVERALDKGIGCAFTLVSSPDVFAEVQIACQGTATLLLQKLIDDLKRAGKLEIVLRDEELTNQAVELNEKTGNKYGRNDFIHALLAKKHADLFVTNDLKFKPTANGIVTTKTIAEFLALL